MPPAVFHQRFCRVFWSRHTEIGNDALRYGLWIIKIYDIAHKVRAIARYDLIGPGIWTRVHPLDEFFILRHGRLDLESVACAVIGGSDQLRPISTGHLSRGSVRSDFFKILVPILVPEKYNQLAIRIE